MIAHNKPAPNNEKSIGQSIQLELVTPPSTPRQSNDPYERSIMTEPSLMVQTERIAVGAVSTNLAKLGSLEAEDYLYNMMRVNEVAVRLELDQNESFDISLTHDLLIKSIRTQKALSELIIGDQLLLVNGKAPMNIEHATKLLSRAMPVLNLIVGRVSYKKPVPINRANAIQLKRHPNHSYFVATVQLVGRVHLGLGIKPHRGKTIVSRTDENSLTAYVFLIGDSILDINGEKITDTSQLRNKMVQYLKKCGQFSAIIEREDPALTAHNVQWSIDKNPNKNIDPQLAIDINQICQREIVRFRLCSKKMKQNKKGGILKFIEDAALTRTQCDETCAQDEARVNQTMKTACSESESRRKGRAKKSSSRSKREDEISTHLTSFFERSKKKKKKVSIQMKNNEEEKITTDAQNPLLLQHIDSANKIGLLTFMPKLFRKNG